MKNILIFMSDQHRFDALGGISNGVLATPNLDKLAKEGTQFTNAVTSSPLCVPARMSFLTSKLPSDLNIFGNEDSLLEEQPTFLHSLAANGYETVLCGRMHFKGANQFHGFTKRIAPDITPQYWGTGGPLRTDLGDFKGTFTEQGCLKVVGPGDSPVEHYDRMVVDAAIEYLARPHSKPQCIVVGTYAPHFTYMARAPLFNKYRTYFEQQLNNIPESSNIPELKTSEKAFDLDTYINTNAAYYGMVEEMDTLIGRVRESWQAYLQRNDQQGIFVYVSDHGDHVGNRKLFGKKTFFDCSVKIPLIVAGDGVVAEQKITEPVSIMDIAPTVTEFTSSMALPGARGVSLVNTLHNGVEPKPRTVLSEVMLNHDGALSYGRLGIEKHYKYFCYSTSQHDYLYQHGVGQQELENLAADEKMQNVLSRLKQSTLCHVDPEETIRRYQTRIQGLDILKAFGQATRPNEPYRYTIPEEYRSVS